MIDDPKLPPPHLPRCSHCQRVLTASEEDEQHRNEVLVCWRCNPDRFEGEE